MDGKAYLFGLKKSKSLAAEGETVPYGFSVFSSDGTREFLELPYACEPVGTQDSPNVDIAAVGADGFAVLDGRGYVDWDARRNIVLTRRLSAYDTAGSRLFSIDPEALVTRRVNPYTGNDNGYEFTPAALYYGASGTLYLVTEFSVVAVSPEGKKLYETGEGVYIQSSYRTADGRILVEYSVPLDGKTYWAYMDDGAQGFSVPVTLPDPGFSDYTLHFAEGWDYYYQTADGLYGMNGEDKAPTLLCDWKQSGLSFDQSYQLLAMSESVYFIMRNNPQSKEREYAVLRRPPDEEIEPRIVVTLGTLNNQVDYQKHAAVFNQANTKYYVRVVDYIARRTEGGNTLEEDVLAGLTPDVVCNSSFGSNANLTGKNVFVDLNEYIDADQALRDSLLSSVRRYCTTDGKLYQLASYTYLTGMAGIAENLPAVEDWTLDAYLRLADECEARGISLSSTTWRESLEMTLLYNNLQSFIDEDGARCSFDSELFLKTVEYLKTVPARENYVSLPMADRIKGFRDGTIPLDNGFLITSFADILNLNFRFSGDGVLLGSPTPAGGKLYMSLQNTYMIASDSSVKEGAWAFVRYMLVNGLGADTSGFPIYKPLIEKLAKEAKSKYYLFGYDGTKSTLSSDPRIVPSSNYDPQRQTLLRLSDEDIQSVMALLEERQHNVGSTRGADKVAKELIAEELAAFYAGNISAEEAARRIQSRVSIYLAEKAG